MRPKETLQGAESYAPIGATIHNAANLIKSIIDKTQQETMQGGELWIQPSEAFDAAVGANQVLKSQRQTPKRRQGCASKECPPTQTVIYPTTVVLPNGCQLRNEMRGLDGLNVAEIPACCGRVKRRRPAGIRPQQPKHLQILDARAPHSKKRADPSRHSTQPEVFPKTQQPGLKAQRLA